jgi:signal transduction histidine kinase
LVRLYFKDNGTGIPERGKGRIFDMFQRLHGPEYPGAGVGLALARKVIERMGGRLGVESEQGKGSCFWVELPAPI